MSQVTINKKPLTGKYENIAKFITGITRTDTIGTTALSFAYSMGVTPTGEMPADLQALMSVVPDSALVEVVADGKTPNRRFTWANFKAWVNATVSIAPEYQAIKSKTANTKQLIERDGVTVTEESAELDVDGFAAFVGA